MVIFIMEDCCSRPIIYFQGNQRKCENCGNVEPDYVDLFTGAWWKPKEGTTGKDCTCGCDKTYGENNNLHSFWCDKVKK